MVLKWLFFTLCVGIGLEIGLSALDTAWLSLVIGTGWGGMSTGVGSSWFSE